MEYHSLIKHLDGRNEGIAFITGVGNQKTL